ncbi:hypothetical protein SAMN03084138_02764 [Enterovibrio norvegicus DSM 15893]|uniref:Uncharacterized protein n=1 Tax=Enterovibrio norvegicus DSM 15893 TaxID=1121869 RepID=A0A1I5S5M6_9GAMM|nr:hypothetical protein SAMN03084138_02764 [Enterovibrio norvegicus DSM 15893]
MQYNCRTTAAPRVQRKPYKYLLSLNNRFNLPYLGQRNERSYIQIYLLKFPASLSMNVDFNDQ